MKPGSCTWPTYGIDMAVLDPQTGHEVTEPDEQGNYHGVLAVRKPWPSIARTCLGDHERYLQTYFKPYKGYYITGDSVIRDSEGFHFIIGRCTYGVPIVVNEASLTHAMFGFFLQTMTYSTYPAIVSARRKWNPHWWRIPMWRKPVWLANRTISKDRRLRLLSCW